MSWIAISIIAFVVLFAVALICEVGKAVYGVIDRHQATQGEGVQGDD